MLNSFGLFYRWHKCCRWWRLEAAPFFCQSVRTVACRLERSEAGQATVSGSGAKNVLSEKQQKAMGGECKRKTV